jgi:hypothetical protein
MYQPKDDRDGDGQQTSHTRQNLPAEIQLAGNTLGHDMHDPLLKIGVCNFGRHSPAGTMMIMTLRSAY